jgi:hypothetical protein
MLFVSDPQKTAEGTVGAPTCFSLCAVQGKNFVIVFKSMGVATLFGGLDSATLFGGLDSATLFGGLDSATLFGALEAARDATFDDTDILA